MKTFLKSISLLLLTIVFTHCGPTGNRLQLDHTNFTDEIATDQNLAFTFSTDLEPDSLTQQWDTTQYLQFQPAVKGKFKWNAKNELIFSPSAPFAPSTDFTATLTDKLFNHSPKKAALPKEKTIGFHTPYLALGNVQTFWAASQKNPGVVEVRMNAVFNCMVKPTDLQQKLHVWVNNVETPFDVITGNADYSIGISIADVRGESNDILPLKLVIDAGLMCVGSAYATKDKMEFTGEVPSKEKVMVTEMTASFESGEGQINVFTNQPVEVNHAEGMVSISPAVKFTVQALDNGFVIKGDFEQDQSYSVTLSKNLKGIFGYTMEKDYIQTVSFGALEPMISFADDKGMYLSSRGARNIAINVAAVNKIKVSVIRIYENNLLSFIGSDEQWGYYDEPLGGGKWDSHDYRYYDYDNYGDVVSEKKYDVQSLPRSGNIRLLHLNLDDLNYDDRFKGMYLLKIQDDDRQWNQQTKFVSCSDIGLIARKGADAVYVFANSIVSADALKGVKVSFISTNNQTIATATTGADGVAILKDAGTTFGQFRLGMITGSLGDDFNFMVLERAAVETSRFDVAGKYINDAHLDAFIYGDREIYRPGDTIYLNTILRTDDWRVMKDAPMKIKLLMPNGKEYQSFRQSPDAQGSFETAFYLPASVITGTYTVEVYTANDVLINSKSLSVEEFVPDRIKVITQLDNKVQLPGGHLKAGLTANNLYGPPAAGRNYEMEFQLNRKDFSAVKYPRYNFSIQTANEVPLSNLVRSGKTDAAGKASETFDVPDYTDIGILSGNVFTTVFDETGRPVHQLSLFTVNTQDVFYGIQNMDEWVSTRKPLTFHFIGCNAAGAAVDAKATVAIYRHEWQNVIEQAGGRYRYRSQRKDVLVSKQDVTLTTDGGRISFTPLNSGGYEVRIMRPGSAGYVSLSFYAYGWGDTQNTSFEVSNEGEVEIQTDKDHYNIGDKAQLMFTTPFEGKILVTIERGSVLGYYYLNTKDKAAGMSIPIKREYLPNVYISATAIRKITSNELPLTVARGYATLKVSNTQARLPVTITASATSRSKTSQHIAVKTLANAELTIAVVDEGILQLKNTLTPDPFNYFYAQRALQVQAFDLYPFLFPEYAGAYSSAPGGDMAEMMNKRTNPFTAKRFNLVSRWSGILKADGNGNASFDVTIPQFSGALRIMAVAYKDAAFGSAEKMMTVADPIVISTALPRFLSPGDRVEVPITLANTTSRAMNAGIDVSINGPVTLASTQSHSVTIAANSEVHLDFTVLASKGVGVADVTVTATNGNERYTDVTHISVRPASTLTKVTGSGAVSGGQSQTISLKADMLPNSMEAQLVLSKSPMAEFSKDLRSLLQYPYGCVEQTVSAAFPQLYYRDLAQALGQQNVATVYNPDYHVQQAIQKLEGMQLYNGAMSYWPGGDYESWWGSAYAAHFLLEAKKAGFDVNDNTLNKLFTYLQQKVKERNTEDWYYQDDHDIARKKTAWSRSTFYSLFVLALADRFDQSAMNYYKAHEDMLTPDSKYMLAALFYLAGNQSAFNQLLPAAWSSERSDRSLDGSFYSDVRDQALALYVLAEADPDNPQVGMMSKHLSEQLRRADWLSTQEAAFSFIALGKIARRAAESNVNAMVMVDGKPAGKFTGTDLTLSKNMANKEVTIQTTGSGTLYYFWEVSGIDVSGKIKEEDSYLKARRTFYNRYGQEINTANIQQNELLVVKLSLSTVDYNSTVDNVALTDLLPAGFEIENPRISSMPDLNWIKDAADYDYMDIRDDRITFFATATARQKNFYYVVRAVSKGTYTMGPVSADAMYNGAYHSYWGAGTVTVK